jgi:hypothetical protein
MAELLNLIESIDRERSAAVDVFTRDKDGTGVRGIRRGPKYLALLAEAAGLVADVFAGKKPLHYLQEAMTRSDFPILFGDIIDRMLLANYREATATYRNYCKVGSVRDFRTAKKLYTEGAEATLSQVGENGEYPERKLNEGKYELAVKKYGARMPISWETLINDDLDALRDIPDRFARAARRTEARYVTDLYAGANGPDAAFFTVGNKNLVTGNPALSIAGLQAAMTALASQVDADGEPIVIEAVELVVPPALQVVAENILNATHIEIVEAGGTANQKLNAQNWMKNKVRLNVDPYLPLVASTANGSTSWFLFANPSTGRPAMELDFLRGHEEPEVFMKAPNAQRVGGSVDAMAGDFDTDSFEYKVRHVLGGTTMDPKAAVASNGSGA